MRTSSRSARSNAGVTLLEVVVAVVMLAILVHFAVPKLVTPAAMTLRIQAQSLADLIRRAQSLAVVRAQRISVRVLSSGANGRVAAACASGAMPCNTDTSLTASQGVVVGNASTIYFNSLGLPLDSAGNALTADATFTLSYQTATCRVIVAALTGRVSVSP